MKVPVKIYILSDMEGTAGVSIWDQVLPGHPEYDVARRWMTEEINAAADGAFAAGADLVLVNDAHLTEHNLDLDLLDRRVEHLMGYGKDLWAELDDTFDAVFQIGAHAKAGTPAANLRHTWAPSNFADLRINGKSVGEIGLAAAGAGERGVPCTLVSGDDKACAEAAQLLGGVIRAPVKKGIGWQCARSIAPRAARDLIRERARQACSAAGGVPPWRPATGEISVEILTIAKPANDLYASSLEADALLAQPLLTQRATGTSIRQAFLAALAATPRPVRAGP